VTTTGLTIGMFSSLGAVVVFLVLAIWRAKKHDVKGHLIWIGTMLVALLVTVVFAEFLGHRYTFSSLSMKVHLPIAILTTLTVLAPLITGYRHWKGNASLGGHKKAVGVWLVLVAMALVTGLWMLSTGEERPAKTAKVGSQG
jgi:hypothetical protein